MEVQFKNHLYYIYVSQTGDYYMTTSRSQKPPLSYNLNLENDQKKFFDDWYFRFRDATIENRMKYQKYSMYDIIINFKKFFKV